MIEVDCSELSTDEKLALASRISDQLDGKAIALVKRDSIVLDQLAKESLSIDAIVPIVSDFISHRSRDAEYYSLELDGETILVHSADPIAASRKKTEDTLPPNLKQCPYCSFITQYEEEYIVHTRSHLFGV